MAKKPKGKMGLWRRLAKKRYDGTTEIRNGRHLRNAIVNMRIGDNKNGQWRGIRTHRYFNVMEWTPTS